MLFGIFGTNFGTDIDSITIEIKNNTNMKTIEGSVEKVFVVINTTNYNNDGKYCVTTAKLSEMENLGFDEEEMGNLDKIDIDTLVSTYFEGCYVMRIA